MTSDPSGAFEALDRFASARVARLATASASGRPHVVPVCFVVLGEHAYSVVDDKPKRTRTGLRRLVNIRENPQVTLLVDHYDEDWSALWFVRIDGEAVIVADEREFATALAALREKYPQYRAMDLAFATHPMLRIRIGKPVAWRGAA